MAARRRSGFGAKEPWTGHWLGLNVIFDLGVFLGECLTSRRLYLRWGYLPGASDDGSSNMSGLALHGFKNARKILDPMEFVYNQSLIDELNIRRKEVGRIVSSSILVGKVRDFSNR